MALISCAECGREISDKAITCPGCGAPVVSQKPVKSVDIPNGGVFVSIDDQTKGPFTTHQLAEMLERGEIQQNTLCAMPGMAEWIPVSSLRRDSSSVPPSSTPPPKQRQEQKTSGPTPRMEAFESTPGQLGKSCPYCASRIPTSAEKCMHCGATLSGLIMGCDHSPMAIAFLSLCCLGGLGQMVVGQVAKGLVLLLISMIVAALTGGLGAFVMWPLTAMDAYMVASKLKDGKPVGSWEFFPS